MEFPNGNIREHDANVIAENLTSRADEEGFSKAIIKCITYFEKYCIAMRMKDRLLYSINGRRHLRKSAMKWKLKVLSNDYTIASTLIKDLK